MNRSLNQKRRGAPSSGWVASNVGSRMKMHLHLLFALSALLLGKVSGESQLTREQVIEIGRIVLTAPENDEYKEIFWNDQPEFDEKRNLWIYRNGFPRTPGGTAYIFEIRESDGHYRLTWLTERKSAPGHGRFRIQPSIRKKLFELFETFNKQNPERQQGAAPNRLTRSESNISDD